MAFSVALTICHLAHGAQPAITKSTSFFKARWSAPVSMDASSLWSWKRLLRVPWTARRSNQSLYFVEEVSLSSEFNKRFSSFFLIFYKINLQNKKIFYLFVLLHQVLAAVCELSVVICGFYFPGQGWNLGPLHWELGVSATEVPKRFYDEVLNCLIFCSPVCT